MYPENVHFERVVAGTAGVLIEWALPDEAELAHIDLWVSPDDVTPDDSEAFYRGELRRRMRCFRFPADSRAFTDPDGGPPRWCALFGATVSGDLVALSFQSRPLDGLVALPPETRDGASAPARATHVGRLAEPPELTFRDDDPKARLVIRASAAAMARG
ncbi:MAG: hypothetical protein IV100_02065 [Myxococcales bacterium]|nr:hypothetical protein [Myxococcales bacterium]